MNSLSYHESHSHGSLGLPFQAYSQEDPYGQYFVPYHWHEEVEFIYVTKGSLVLRTQNRTRLLQEGHIYFINPGTLHGLFGNSPFSHHYALVFRLDMLNFLQTDSCQTSYLVPLCTGKYLFPDSEALAPELTAQIAALIKSSRRVPKLRYLADCRSLDQDHAVADSGTAVCQPVLYPRYTGRRNFR